MAFFGYILRLYCHIKFGHWQNRIFSVYTMYRGHVSLLFSLFIELSTQIVKKWQNLKMPNFGHKQKMGYFQLICDLSKPYQIWRKNIFPFMYMPRSNTFLMNNFLAQTYNYSHLSISFIIMKRLSFIDIWDLLIDNYTKTLEFFLYTKNHRNFPIFVLIVLYILSTYNTNSWAWS